MESEERAIEIAAKLSAVPGPDGVATQPIQVRQVASRTTNLTERRYLAKQAARLRKSDESRAESTSI